MLRTGRWVIALTFLGNIGVASIGEAQIGGWVSANVTAAMPAEKRTTQETSVQLFPAEFFKSTFVYSAQPKPSFDIGFGVRLLPQFGVGLAVTGYSDSEPADISFTFPHPFLINRPASTSGNSIDRLKNEETTLHIEARYLVNRPHASLAVFAGPSYVRATKEIVTAFTYYDLLPSPTSTYTVTFRGETDRQAVELSAWGMNVGADVGYFFNENTGVGFQARFSRAEGDLPNRFASTNNPPTQPIKLGGVSAGGGVRFRF